MITGIILSGGQSSRMGKNKSLLLYEGKPIIAYVVEAIRSFVKDVMVITNEPEFYSFLENVTFKEDIIKGKGPMGGIYTGLHYAETDLSFVVACDMPFIKGELIPFLEKRIGDAWGCIPFDGEYFETLAALYNKELEGFFYSFLKGEIKKLQYLLKGLNVVRVDDRIIYKEFGKHIFYNMNTQESYEKIKRETSNE
ncbi:hypothetical protein AZF37_01555 [endosymbiont 'TC1' of Trimyema compressum]|uniref:molybdenum cofactor guanylyltransferase n=1 Tax=endosymbiont 'TC1' of Trimyema compressum TaxID=243899 RepID=UPI0007F07674|nr:molybdenum cofactor guanylyltransferase [endosymbiont 'TC1' of Trimyema compressum]AMP20034.1 hypothetical protein AZF37_01555 [endosymbiont 'TC1' of Trimyema compressum]